ncbi:putative bifunctional diguanylate cyclase/phosphodiesterase [Nitratireductor sp. CH_MIT9313-5]|uniref:putative bifunctional diguanylate cyclase/phosphodiesterase n=1 Tax=Nitratireductor sp. CH_MIT9313-5 TaxID=3107764 RepID=UPI003008A4C3
MKNLLTAVSKHGSPLYIGTQTLLASASASAAASAFLQYQHVPAAIPAAAAAIGTAAAACTLAALRHNVVRRLYEAARIEAERRELIETDLMTGAKVRRTFLEELAESTGSLRRKRRATVLLVDLDHFKQLNDGFGHRFGDQALAHLVSCIRECFSDGSVGRLGGDEFGIILPGDDLKRARKKAERLIDLLNRGMDFEGSRVSLSASVGIAASPAHATSPTELMQLADLALYESKARGRGRATLFDEDMLSEKRQRRFVERELRAAIYLNELELHYQPIKNGSRETYAVEGLIRWRHPVRGMVSPAEFIPVAERSNLIDQLGEWVFRRACADLPMLGNCCVSINVSGEQLKRDEVVTMMSRVVEETGIDPARFVLEITETVATSAGPETVARITALREMGFKIALDDFGTGHCGFNYIKTLPIDCIKIDRSYIQHLKDDEIAQVFVSALTQIARIQGLSIVAEGIETETEFELAKAAGCSSFQGYLLGRPERRLLSMPHEVKMRQVALSA